MQKLLFSLSIRHGKPGENVLTGLHTYGFISDHKYPHVATFILQSILRALYSIHCILKPVIMHSGRASLQRSQKPTASNYLIFVLFGPLGFFFFFFFFFFWGGGGGEKASFHLRKMKNQKSMQELKTTA